VLSEAIELLRDLVECDTSHPRGNELWAARILRDWLDTHSIEAEIEEFLPGRANLLARVVGEEPGPCLMLNTHTDVVPAGDGWNHEPFSGEVTDGRLYGRGAADAKGSLAAMAATLVLLKRAASLLRGEVVLAAVADEEVGSAGTRRLLEHYRPDAAIVGEPTGLRLLTAHKGSLRPVIEVTGRAAHAATPDRGRNAVEGAADLMLLLRLYAADLEQRKHSLVGHPTVVPVFIMGGEAPNTVPEHCRITLDRRMVPGESEEGVLRELEEISERFEEEHPGMQVRAVDMAPTTGGPSETPVDDAFIVAARKALGKIGQITELGGLTVNCDMTHFRSVGVPAVVYGPGHPEAMHVADEHVALADLRSAIDGYEAIATELLGESSTWLPFA